MQASATSQRRPKRRMVILTEGHLNIWEAKTAVPVIRYRPDEVACVLDSAVAGKDLFALVGVGRGIPIVRDLREALRYKPNTLLIGIAPVGGKLPAPWRKLLVNAMAAELNIISGLHTFLGDDPALARAAKKYRRTIWDVRRVPDGIGCANNLARKTKCKRIATVGSDCALGKLTVALELTAEAQRRGHDAEMVATGQTGIIIAGSGIPIDRTISDFTNGAAERLILERQHREMLFIEGQGSIGHPAYSAVTLGLLHGSAPQAMILCHHPPRKFHTGAKSRIAPLPHLVRVYENLASLVCPSKVIGVALNTFGMSDSAARRAVAQTERETKLPATDVIRFGIGKLMDAVEKYFR